MGTQPAQGFFYTPVRGVNTLYFSHTPRPICMGAARIFCRGGIEAPSSERRRCEVEAPQAGAEGIWVWGGGFSIFELKKASFGAFWVLFFEVELNGNWLRPLSGMY